MPNHPTTTVTPHEDEAERWFRIRGHALDLVHGVELLHGRVQAFETAAACAYSENTEVGGTPYTEEADAAMLARLLDHVQMVLAFVVDDADKAREAVAASSASEA